MWLSAAGECNFQGFKNYPLIVTDSFCSVNGTIRDNLYIYIYIYFSQRW